MSSIKSTRFIVIIVLFLILCLAFFVRFYHIESIPAGIYPDEAANGVDALHALETKNFDIFYPANFGREGLFINLQAISIALFGNTITGLKIWSILFGTCSVLGIFLLARELFQRQMAGLLAGFMLATSYWAINFSRIGFRAIMTTFLLVFSFYFFFRGLRTRRFRDFFIAGLIFGIGVHTYVAFRLAPLILILLLPALFLSYPHFLQRFWKHAGCFIIGAFITASPMLFHFFITHPEDFASRSSHISIFSPEVNHGNAGGTLAKTFATSLIKYNFFGDQNWRHNYPPYPILDPFVGTFFLAGFLFLIWQTVTLLGKRFREGRHDARLVTNTFLIVSFFTMLAPEFLTNEGLPHALRSIGTQMPVFLIATIPALWIFTQATRSKIHTKIALFCTLLFILIISALFNFTKYFVFFAHSPAAGSAFNENYTNMGRYLLTLPNETQKYILIDEQGNANRFHLPVFAHPVYFLTYHRVANLHIINGDTTFQGPGVLLMLHYNETLAKKFQDLYPNTFVEHIDMNGSQRAGGDFDVIILPERKK
ncbi:MAG: ArnT family glycosyltransferase [Minisyncoccota bacterium]